MFTLISYESIFIIWYHPFICVFFGISIIFRSHCGSGVGFSSPPKVWPTWRRRVPELNRFHRRWSQWNLIDINFVSFKHSIIHIRKHEQKIVSLKCVSQWNRNRYHSIMIHHWISIMSMMEMYVSKCQSNISIHFHHWHDWHEINNINMIHKWFTPSMRVLFRRV
jgi:hypothetical protein